MSIGSGHSRGAGKSLKGFWMVTLFSTLEALRSTALARAAMAFRIVPKAASGMVCMAALGAWISTRRRSATIWATFFDSRRQSRASLRSPFSMQMVESSWKASFRRFTSSWSK